MRRVPVQPASWTPPPADDRKLPPFARWSLSGLAVAAIHGGALWMALNWVSPSAPMGLPDQPIMIEMEPVAAPEETPPSVAPPGPEVPKETPPEPAPPEAEPPPPEPEPVAEPEPPQPDPPPEPEPPPPEPEPTPPEIAPEPPVPPLPPTPPVAEAEAVLPPEPKPAPKVRTPKPVVKKRVERKQARVRQKTAPAAVQAPRREQPASAGVPTVSAASRASWQSQVASHLNRYKRSPANGATGTARVAFRIGSGGQVLSVSLTGSSGDPALDQEAVALVRRASPVPAPPAGMGSVISLAVPVRFTR